MKKGFRKTSFTIIGTLVVLIGIVMIPYPGPGWLVVFFGLSILAKEYTWAENILEKAKRYFHNWTEWTKQQRLLIRLAIMSLTALAVIVTLWLINAYHFLNIWLNLNLDWLQSPLFS